MIKVTSYTNQPGDELYKYMVKSFADTKAELTDEAVFVGLPENGVLMPGSLITTAAGEQALLNSEGNWNWLPQGGGGGGTNVSFVGDAMVLS